ncbi:MAG: ABC transporter ATP-binding protein, partial [Chloroflexota bacterium]
MIWTISGCVIRSATGFCWSKIPLPLKGSRRGLQDMSAVSPALNERKEGKQKGQKQAGPVGSMRLLIRFMAGQRSVFTMAGLMLIFAAATAVLAPLLVAYVINYLSVRLTQIDGKAVAPPLSPMAMLGLPDLVNPDFDTIAIVTIGIIVLTMINSLGDSLAEIYLARGGRRLGYNLRVGLYSHLQRLSLAFHDQRRTGDILTRVTSDVAALEDFIISSLSDITGSILLIGFILIAMLRYQWQVAVVAAIIIPVMALVSNYFTTRIKSASKKLRASEGELASAAQEMLTSIRVIQTYGLGSYEQEMFADQSQKAMDSALEAAGLQARFSWVVSVMGAFSTAAVIWVAVYLIFRDPLLGGIGLLTAFIKYIQDMFKPTKRIIQEWNTLAKLYASLERIADLLDRKPAVQDLPGAVDAPPFKGHIEFRNVSFAYAPNPASQKSGKNEPPRLALKGLSFEVGVGQVLAIVGHTGAGKSTIVQLLPRLYDPSDGQILFDGHDIREFKLDSLRAQMSMVLQETILFSGSVVENVAYGRTDATWGEIIAAAKQANAHEFIERMPERYYTLLGERGANLSGGQRQRIAIARAFIRNTPILILDEPSTGLDAESTELVLNALRVLMKGKTTIIISHDLNLIRSADTIVVIKQGEVEQIGNHESLLEAGGLYANLYMKQYGYKDQKQALQAEAIYSGREMLAETGKEMIMETSVEDLFADLARSPSMLSKLPALATAFDPEIMKQTLQRVLFGKDNNTSSSYYIETCTPGKAIYLPENVCNMQYSLKVKDPNSGELFKTIVNARLFPDAMACENFWRESLTPLSAKVRGRPEVEPFVTTSAVLEDLNMTISVYPIDGLLPTLLDATDRERMKNLFSETLPEVLSGSFELENVKPEVVHYGRYRRCVLRYVLEGKEPESGEPMHLTLFGKVDSDSYGALSIPV